MTQRTQRISEKWKDEVDNLYNVIRVQKTQIDELKARLAAQEGAKK